MILMVRNDTYLPHATDFENDIALRQNHITHLNNTLIKSTSNISSSYYSFLNI